MSNQIIQIKDGSDNVFPLGPDIISNRVDFSIAANSSAAIYSFNITVPSGYTFVCPGSWMVGNSGLAVYGVRKQSDTQIGIYANNPGNTAVNCQVQLIFTRSY